MPLILAIEPDTDQATALSERLGDDLHAEVLVVADADTAIAMLGGRVPELVLLGRALTAGDQERIAGRLRAESDGSPIPRVAIPDLRHAHRETACYDDVDAPGWSELTRACVRALEVPCVAAPEHDASRREADADLAAIRPAGEVAERMATVESPGVESHDHFGFGGLESWSVETRRAADGGRAVPTEARWELESLAALAAFDPEPDTALLANRARAIEEELQVTELSVLTSDTWDGAGHSGTGAAGPHTTDLGNTSAAADFATLVRQLGVEATPPSAADVPAPHDLDWFPSERQTVPQPEEHAADSPAAAVHTAARLASELARARDEVAADHAVELARVRAEAAAAQEVAVTEARAAADAHARAMLARELAALRGEAEEKLASELARVRAAAARNVAEQIGQSGAPPDQVLESELARARAATDAVRATAVAETRVAAESAATKVVSAELDRVRVETEARLEAELVRLRAEADAARRAQELAQRDADARREEAAREARAEAEADAARTLALEVERVRAEAEARLGAELARVQAQADLLMEAEQASRIEVAQVRDAARDVARAAEHAAARTVEHELARVRAEVEAQLQAELARVRLEADEAGRARDEAERQSEAARDAAAREAQQAAEDAGAKAIAAESERLRAEADARLAAETERARREADARLAAELAAFTAEAERRRQLEISEMRSQMAQLRDAAAYREHIRPDDLLMSGGGPLDGWSGPARPSFSKRLLQSRWPRKAAMGAVVLAVVSFVVDLPAMVKMTAAVALPWITVGEPEAAAAEAAPPPPSPTGLPARTRPPAAGSSRPAIPAGAGALVVASRIPIDIYTGTRRLGTSDGQLLLAPGSHQLRLVSNRYNYREEVTVEIRAGLVTTHTVPLPLGRLRIRTSVDAEVMVEGNPVGRGPLVEVSVPIGTREVSVRHSEFGARRSTVEVRHELVAEIVLPLDQPGGTTAPHLPPLSRAAGR